ncbi:hypothetical protein AAMO2058_000073200 [Amorphochlora amoebiformis]
MIFVLSLLASSVSAHRSIHTEVAVVQPEAPVANSTVEAPIAMAVNATAMAQMNKTMVDTSLLKGCCFTFTATDSEMQLEPPREDRTPVDCAQESDYWSATTDCPKRTFDAMFLAFSHIHEFEGKKISPSLVKLNDTDPAQRILSLTQCESFYKIAQEMMPKDDSQFVTCHDVLSALDMIRSSKKFSPWALVNKIY